MSRTHEALLRADEKHKQRSIRNNNHLDIEQKLRLLNLGKEHLINQNLSELKQSLNTINKCLEDPSTALDIITDDSVPAKKYIFPILIRRKRLLLELIDTAVTGKSISKIRVVLKNIQDNNIQAKIEKPLSWLDKKNEFLKKEYQSIAIVETDQSIASAESERLWDAPAVSSTHSVTQETKKRKQSRPLLARGSLSILITASLLCIWGVAMTFTHFLKTPFPIIQKYAFLVTLGFFFGIMFRTLQKGGTEVHSEKKKG